MIVIAGIIIMRKVLHCWILKMRMVLYGIILKMIMGRCSIIKMRKGKDYQNDNGILYHYQDEKIGIDADSQNDKFSK
jgi:hypothetical protein